MSVEVYKAICAVMGKLAVTGISKDSTNTFDKYKFRGIDAVYNTLAPLLAEAGLLVLPRVLERHSEERVSEKNKALFYVTVKMELDFVAASDGSKHTICAYGEAMDRGDKATNKAMTAAYKYALFEAFCIPTEGSDDADRESHEVEPRVAHGTPSGGVWESLSEEAQAYLVQQVETARERLSIGDAAGAVEFMDSLGLDADEKVAIWTRFGFKRTRSAMKRTMNIKPGVNVMARDGINKVILVGNLGADPEVRCCGGR